MEHKRKKLSGSANRKLKEEKEARQKAFLEKMPTLTNFFKKGETLSMDITQGEQHKEGKEKNHQQYDNNAQQSNVKEKEED